MTVPRKQPSARAPRRANPVTSAPAGQDRRADARRLELAEAETRLAALLTEPMPWLDHGMDLSPPDGGPEHCGPAEYVPPSRRR